MHEKEFDSIYKVHLGDARGLVNTLPNSSVDVTITSPPYFDLKDYGSDNQIGFGQDYETYLSDLEQVFAGIYSATKDEGSLWIVIDSFRKNQEVYPLPFDLASKLKNVGWVLRDVIIWKKQKTLPWAHKGSTRKIFEYIMVFSKTTKQFRYFPDRHRETTGLKKWWVKYPERYNPKGKSLEEIWSFDIPTQGSWGNKYIQHFCPLPADLVTRIIELTTNVGDVVLDPFSGSGTVPTEACLLERKYIGFELNAQYIEMFNKYLQKKLTDKKTNITSSRILTDEFENLIIDLRVLKYARLMYREVRKKIPNVPLTIFTRKLGEDTDKASKIQKTEITLLGLENITDQEIKDIVKTQSAIPPLSRFGIEYVLVLARDIKELPSVYKNSPLFSYTYTNSHKYSEAGNTDLILGSKNILISPIKVAVEEPND